MIVLGLVGTPAGGKSTAAKYLAGLGAEWINADFIARDCLGVADVVSQLSGRFGDTILQEDGSISRARVADLVFGDDPVKRANLKFLESIIHPRTRVEIRDRIVRAARGDRTVALLDVPLLFESGWDLSCDAIWCVDASRAKRLQRSQKRGWDEAELIRREANQMPIETKSRLSNHVMRNETTLDALHQKLDRAWADLVRMKGDVGRGIKPESAKHCVSDRDFAP